MNKPEFRTYKDGIVKYYPDPNDPGDPHNCSASPPKAGEPTPKCWHINTKDLWSLDQNPWIAPGYSSTLDPCGTSGGFHFDGIYQ
jgi:hypothetical protein